MRELVYYVPAASTGSLPTKTAPLMDFRGMTRLLLIWWRPFRRPFRFIFAKLWAVGQKTSGLMPF